MQFAITSHAFPAVPPDVAAVFGRSSDSQGSWGWFQTLAVQTLRAAETALVFALRDEAGRPCAALPLVRLPDGTIRGLSAPYTTLFAPPLGSPVYARALGVRMRAFVGRRLMLDALAPEDPAIQALKRGLGEGGLLCAGYRHFANHFEAVTTMDRFWEARGSRLRSTVRRKQRSLERDGRLRFESFEAPAEVDGAIDVYERLYALSWKEPEPDPDFMPAMMRALAREGSLRLALAVIDGTPAAAQVWLVSEGRATIFKLAQDPGYDKLSPGTLLTHWMVSRTVDRDHVTEIDFGRGDDRYKRDWLGQCRCREGFIACNPGSIGGLYDAMRLVLPTWIAAKLHDGKPPEQSC
jgi:CelD/BcsL family acetyltransferase involved in cellulose biosynthesis